MASTYSVNMNLQRLVDNEPLSTPISTPAAQKLRALADAHVESYENALKQPSGGPYIERRRSSSKTTSKPPFSEAYVAQASIAIATALSSHYLPGFVSYTFGTATPSTLASVTGWLRAWFSTGIGMNTRIVAKRVDIVSAYANPGTINDGNDKETRVDSPCSQNGLDEDQGHMNKGNGASATLQPKDTVSGLALCSLTFEITPYHSSDEPWTWTNVYGFRARINTAGEQEAGFEFAIADNEVLELMKRRPHVLDGFAIAT